MKKCILYYSKSGNTEYVANYLAGKIDAALVKLVEVKGRNGVFGFVKSGFQALKKKASKLEGNPWEEVGEYDEIYFMTPIWAGNGTPAFNAFMDKMDLNGKRIYVVTLQADPGKKGSAEVHEYFKTRIENAGGHMVDSYALSSAPPNKYAGNEHLEKEVDDVILKKLVLV
ncbi:Flavodoxin [Dethiosulfatibacter aminovorans DSM 17477]|uniref:Flavodoxin n=1 Tax=Dethiosulfatibacter aminovorans DSM 17477 TaxID=1121476 RepID=A0A1M6BNC0_9FIRM|nr:flavodoxin family protein [Dethiosulfatibacter aminovorans]SHI50144.1 Flavodoxin [Dethiosulfatibacter aminovorans DSM 17477]